MEEGSVREEKEEEEEMEKELFEAKKSVKTEERK